MVEVQNPSDGKWYPYPENDWYNGNIRVDGGQPMSHEMYQQQQEQAAPTEPEPPTAPTAPTVPPTGTGSPNWNNGSPPDQPLNEGHGWTFNGTDWIQTPGTGIGYTATPAAPTGGNVSGSGGGTAAPSGGGGPVSPGNGGGGGGTGGSGSSGDYMAPIYDDAAADAALLGEDPGALPEWVAPVWDAPENFAYTKTFAAPTEETLLADPSYKFRLAQGQKALENSAAGKGLLRSGGTLKDLVDYGQNFATNEYSNVYNRGFNEYKFDFDKSADIWTKNYNKSRDEFDKMYKGKFDEFTPKLTGWQTKTNNRARAGEVIADRNWRRDAADRDRWSSDSNSAADRALRQRQIEQDDIY